MRGLMQDRPLLIASMIEHAANYHGDTEIVSRPPSGETVRTTWRETDRRARRLARALARLGLGHGDRAATLAWNNHRHLELYYGIACAGHVCHTINPRLFFEQIRYIVNHADDRVIFFDTTFTDLVERLAPLAPGVRHWVALCDRADLPSLAAVPDLLCYEDILAAEADDFVWPTFEEATASSLCYTSGTTGEPKGVLYAHRSTVLHTMALIAPDNMNLSACDVMLPAASMYHANAWGMPYAATMVGAKLVLPGAKLDGASLHALFESEAVTVSLGVPTIWLGYAQYLEQHATRPTTLRHLLVGGSAVPPAMIEEYARKYGVEVQQLWGMTETSPLGVSNRPKRKHVGRNEDVAAWLRTKQGRVAYGVELEIVDDSGTALPHDGVAYGDVLIRGPWIASGYFGSDRAVLRDGGWFPTGDVATLCPDGYLRITDRSKDVIKSGGEWISSIDLENAAVGHPAVAEAAVVGVPHPKWDERPLLLLVLKPGMALTKPEMLAFLADRVAKWWLPDDVLVIDEIPHTATGKILKTELRRRYADWLTRPATITA